MRVALVNTNRYLLPPVAPVGVEYLLAPLERAGHEVSFLDLAFAPEPEDRLVSFLGETDPDLTGFSVRNVDTALPGPGSAFFLEGVRALVAAAKERTGGPVVVGGASTLCSRENLRSYLDAEFLVAGPGERALPELVERLSRGVRPPPVIDGWSSGIDPGLAHPRGMLFDYSPYINGGNPVGLEFRKGCPRGCPFCVEANRPILARRIPAVLEEVRALADAGVSMVFFCDSEVNLDTDETCGMLRAIEAEETGIEWTGYFRPAPFDAATARLAARSGCSSLTLSVSSLEVSGETGRGGGAEVSLFLRLCAEEGIRVAADLLVGYPGEPRGSIERALDLLAEARPATVGVTPRVRLYEGTAAASAALNEAGRIVGRIDGNPGLLEPVFFEGVDAEWLAEKVSGDPLFVIEGTSHTVNYQRL